MMDKETQDNLRVINMTLKKLTARMDKFLDKLEDEPVKPLSEGKSKTNVKPTKKIKRGAAPPEKEGE